MIYRQQRMQVAETMRRLYRCGLTTCSGGNISLRVGKSHVLMTPSALDKGNLNFRQIALMTLEGENLSPGLKTSIETDMHLKILRTRPDMSCVIHAHPRFASLFSASRTKTIDTDLVAEARYLLGEPAFAPYALMGTEGLGDSVSMALSGGASSVIMENHGVLTLGTTLLQAFDRMEVLEAAADMSIHYRADLEVSALSDNQLERIDKLHQ